MFPYFNFDVKMFNYSQKQFYHNTEVFNRKLFHTASSLSGHCSHISKWKLQGYGTFFWPMHTDGHILTHWHLYLYTHMLNLFKLVKTWTRGKLNIIFRNTIIENLYCHHLQPPDTNEMMYLC